MFQPASVPVLSGGGVFWQLSDSATVAFSERYVGESENGSWW